MNVKEYIQSGVVESYVLGLATDAEQKEFEQACAELVKEAKENGGEDNITVIIAKLSGNGLKNSESDEVQLEMIDLGNIHDTADQEGDTAEMD